MKICYAHLEDALQLAEQQLQLSFPRGTTWIASRFDDGRLAGVAVFAGVGKGNCFLHIAGQSPRWFTPQFCREMLAWAFHALHCRRITASIEAGNRKCRRLAEHVGFVREGYARGFDFGDLVFYGLQLGEGKWAEL